MITVSKEDYLKAILEAEGEGEQVIAARLAHWLSVSAPAVTMALRRLKRMGWCRSARMDEYNSPAKAARLPVGWRFVITSSSACCTRSSAWRGTRCTMKPSVWSMLSPAISGACSRNWAAEGLSAWQSCDSRTSQPKRKRGLLLLSETLAGSRYAVQSVYERDRKLGEFLEKLGVRPGAEIDRPAAKLRRHADLPTPAGKV